jgi:diguanylate cyclase (GGDEF)-like protein/PAS domain S-box-containing protein
MVRTSLWYLKTMSQAADNSYIDKKEIDPRATPLWRTLRGRTLVVCVALVVLLGVSISLAVNRFATEALERQLALNLSTVAASVRSRVDLTHSNLFQQIATAARRDTLIGTQNRGPRLDLLRAAQPAFEWIGFVDLNGRVTDSAERVLQGENVLKLAWFRAAVGSAHLQRLYPGLEPSVPEAPFAVAAEAKDARGVATGVLVARLSPDTLRGLIRAERQTHFLARGLEIAVFTVEGKLLAGTGDQFAVAAGQPGFREALAGKEAIGWESWQMQGGVAQRFLTAYSALRGEGDYGGPGWIVMVRRDEESALAPVRNLNGLVIGISALFTALSVFAALLLGAWLTRPIRAITDSAERIKRGEQDVEFPSGDSPIEVHTLSSALRDMVRALADKERVLQAGNVILEQRVNERTAALLDATTELDNERERLAYALEGSMLSTWDCDVATGVVRLSHGWSRMLGGPAQETTTTIDELLTLVPRAERKAIVSAVIRVMKGEGYRYIVEHRVRCADGGTIWVASRGKVTERDALGRATRLTGTCSDVSIAKRAEQALKDSEAKLKLVTDNIPFMINYLDLHCRMYFANRPYLDFLGLDGEDVAGKSLSEVAGVEAQRLAESMLPRLEAGEFVRYGRVRADRHGRMRHLDILQIPHFDHAGQLIGFISMIEDATERGEAERALAASEAQLRLVSDNIPTMLCEVDLDGRLLFVNRRYNEFYGLSEGEALGRRIIDIAGEGGQRAFEAHLTELKAGHSIVYSRPTQVAERNVYLEVHLVPRVDEGGVTRTIYAMINDVTARKQLEDLLKQQALSDALTGLPNRRLLRDRCEHAIAVARRQDRGVALLYMDLDEFKPVNDTLGHEAGDRLLQQVAERLAACVRESDTVARVGGDEFVVLLVDCELLTDAGKVAGAILDSLALPFILGDGTANVSCSIGIAIFPADGASAEDLINAADAAMYQAKRSGKSRFAAGTRPGGTGDEPRLKDTGTWGS